MAFVLLMVTSAAAVLPVGLPTVGHGGARGLPGGTAPLRTFLVHPSTAGLNLSPGAGPIATQVAASGSGFAANTTISFSFGSGNVASSCATDATGVFPGSSRTHCDFRVPTAPRGPALVTASEPAQTTLAATVPIGSQPYAYTVAYDAGRGEVFVANYASNNLSVISGSNDSIVATVAVGSNPYAIAYDSGQGEIYVANQGSNNVTVVNDTTDSVVATVAVGGTPYDIAYDAAAGEVYVANYHSNNVSAISDTSHKVVASIPVGTGPVAVTADDGVGEVAVANFNTNNVTLFSDATDSVVGNVATGSGPYWVAYDPHAGQLFVPNIYTRNVSVLSDSTNRLVATVPVGANPGFAVFDRGTDEVFVGNGGSSNVSVISDTTDSVVANVPVGSAPNWLAYDSDPGIGQVFVANQGSNNVSVVADASATVVATLPAQSSPISIAFDPSSDAMFVANQGAPNVTVLAVTPGATAVATFNVTPTVLLSPAHGPVGSVINVTGTQFQANASIALSFGGVAITTACSADATGSFPGTTGTTCTVTVPITPVGLHAVVASDGANNGTAEFTVSSGLQISPTSGTVGTTITATGTGFAANSSIGFTLNGAPATSSCTSNASGSFPASGGPACTFVAPDAPGGPQTVVASEAGSNSVAATVAIGNQPYAYTSAYDSGRGEIFVACYSSNNVTVLSDTTNAVVANIAVGVNPYAIAYDPARGEVFVANQGSTSTVSVISDSNNTVVATLTIGRSAYEIAYDPGVGEVFVANYGSNNVSIISDTTNTLVATVAVGTGPVALTYDPGLGEIFVANFNSNNVTVISDATNSVVANIAVGSGAYWGTYDAKTGEIYVPNIYNANVSVIADSNNSVVATVPVGTSPGIAAYDPNLGEIFVGDGGSNNVSVISDKTHSVVATIPVGSAPNTIVFDAALGVGELFVANEGSNNVSVILDATNAVVATLAVGTNPVAEVLDPTVNEVFVANFGSNNESVILSDGNFATATFTVGASVSVVRANDSADVGQSVSVVGKGFGAGLNITSMTLGGIPISCSAATKGTCLNGSLAVDGYGDVVANVTVPAVTSSGRYVVNLTDAMGDSATADLLVSLDPAVTTPTASAGSADVGQSVAFQATASFGSSPYTFTWTGLPSGCTATLGAVTCTPTGPGKYTVVVRVTDANGYSVTSPGLKFTVYADPLSGVVVASLLSGAVDAGQSVVFTAQPSLGSLAYTAFNWSGLPAGCLGLGLIVNCTGTALPGGQYNISVTVTDSNNVTSLPSDTLGFVVNGDPLVSTPLLSPASIDAGQHVVVSVTASRGSGLYTYAWTGLPAACGNATTTAVNCLVTVPGTFTIRVQVTDSLGVSGFSPSATLNVYADPTVSVAASRVAFDAEQPVLLTATASGGSGGFAYVWSGLPTGCAGSSSVVSCTPTDSGTASVTVRATDSNGEAATSSAIGLTVARPLLVTPTYAPSFPLVGVAVNFSSTVSGGTGPISVAWSFGDGTNDTGPSVQHAYTNPGEFSVTVWVNDSGGGAVKSSLTVDVTSPGSTPITSSGSSLPIPWILAGAVIVLAAVAAVIYLVRRRRASRPDDAPAGEEPEAGSETAPMDEGLPVPEETTEPASALYGDEPPN